MGTEKSCRDDASRDSGDRPRRRCENRAAAWGAWKVPDRVDKSTESVRMSLVHHRRSQQKMPCWKGCSSEIDRLCRMKRVEWAIQYASKRVSSTNLVVVKVRVEKGQFNGPCRGWRYTLNWVSSIDLVGVKVGYMLKGVSSTDLVRLKVHLERSEFNTDLVKVNVCFERGQFNRPYPGEGTRWKGSVHQILSGWR